MNKLKQAIERSGYRKDFIAKHCKVQPYTLSRWIKDPTKIPAGKRAALVWLLGPDVFEADNVSE